MVACYLEDLAWLRDVPPDWVITIYRKESEKHRGLRNVGWEPYTYLHHIITHYDALADSTVFCQGDAPAHWPDFVNCLDTGQVYFGGVLLSDPIGRPHHSESFPREGPYRQELCERVTVHEYSRIFGLPLLETYESSAGSHYRVTRNQIRSRNPDFYKGLQALSVFDPMATYTLERLWPIIWGISMREINSES